MYSGVYVLAAPGTGKSWFQQRYCDPFAVWDTDWLMHSAVDQERIFRQLIKSNVRRSVTILTNRIAWTRRYLEEIEVSYPAGSRFCICHKYVPSCRDYLAELYPLYWQFQEELLNRGWNCTQLDENKYLSEYLGDFPIDERGFISIQNN